MVYRVIGIMSGSSLDGLDIAFVELHENAGKWNYEIVTAACYPYTPEWTEKLRAAISLSALDYQLLHVDYGHFIGQQVNRFIEEHQLQYKVALVASHGHTTFHIPARKMTAQLGDGAAIAAETNLPVVADLRALDIALGGQGAPIVPVGEKLLLGKNDYFLNLGGIANISLNTGKYTAFDVCPANKVLNMLANEAGREFDESGLLAASGNVQDKLLEKLNRLAYYSQPFPKSLANEFGTDTVFPLIKQETVSTNDALRTYVEHIVIQIMNAVVSLGGDWSADRPQATMLITGGGAFNTFLVEQLRYHLRQLHINVLIPDDKLVKYKEALIMGLIGVLRWRQEYNVFASVTGANRDSIGGALWNGQEA